MVCSLDRVYLYAVLCPFGLISCFFPVSFSIFSLDNVVSLPFPRPSHEHPLSNYPDPLTPISTLISPYHLPPLILFYLNFSFNFYFHFKLCFPTSPPPPEATQQTPFPTWAGFGLYSDFVTVHHCSLFVGLFIRAPFLAPGWSPFSLEILHFLTYYS